MHQRVEFYVTDLVGPQLNRWSFLQLCKLLVVKISQLIEKFFESFLVKRELHDVVLGEELRLGHDNLRIVRALEGEYCIASVDLVQEWNPILVGRHHDHEVLETVLLVSLCVFHHRLYSLQNFENGCAE